MQKSQSPPVEQETAAASVCPHIYLQSVVDSKGHKQRVMTSTHRIVRTDLRKLWSWTTTDWRSQRILPFARGDLVQREREAYGNPHEWKEETLSLKARRTEGWFPEPPANQLSTGETEGEDGNRQTGAERRACDLRPCATSSAAAALNQSERRMRRPHQFPQYGRHEGTQRCCHAFDAIKERNNLRQRERKRRRLRKETQYLFLNGELSNSVFMRRVEGIYNFANMKQSFQSKK